MASPPGSDMSLEDAAAIQQDLAGGGVVAAQRPQEEETTQLQDDSVLQIADDPRDAPTMSMLADIAGANEIDEQSRRFDEESAAAPTAQVEAQTTEEHPIELAATEDSHNGGVQAQAQAHTTAEEEVQPLAPLAPSSADNTNASLDALLGSLAESHDHAVNINDQSASNDQSIDELASASLSGVSNVEAMDEGESAVQSTEQEQEASTTGPSSAAQENSINNDETMADEAQAQAQESEPSLASASAEVANQPTDWSTFVAPDASGPVPGLPSHIAIDTFSTNQDATMDNQASHPQVSQIRQEATPAGTPTLLPASLPSSQQQGQAQQDPVSTTITAPSSSSSTPILKITQLASDPNLAYSTAQQLLSSRPQTLSRLQKLRKRVEVNKFDGEAWLELINDALQKGDLDRTREVYDQFLQNFPDNAREWIAYADLELSHGNNERVNEIFGRCLRTSTSVQLWHFYLTYIRRTNPIDRSSAERSAPARDIITKAFEFSLAHVGADLEAGPIWYDYIEFLKEGDVSGTWEAQQKMDKLRQTYQRAVCIPLSNIEQLWQGYDAFENNLNRATAKRFLQDRSPAYMTARAIARQLQNFMGRLSFGPVPRKPNWDSAADQAQLQVWKDMLKYEESDPMELGDQASIRTRVLLAYKKALTQLRFYPEIWHMAAAYARSQDKADEAMTFYKAGMEANPTSLLLHYAYAELEESKGHNEECHKVYNGLLERLQTEIESTTTAMQTEIKEALEEKARIEAQEKAARNQNMMRDDDDDDEVSEEVRNKEKESIRHAITESKTEHLNELKRLAGSVWIMQMRFARRAEGIQQARGVFSRARKWPHVTWHVFEASAMLEMHWNKETKIATNVFEVGLKRFNDEVGFVKRYLDFLIMINDDGNARAVFERTVTRLPADKARPLWKRWSEYLYQYGDLASIQKVDARLMETYPDVPAIERFVERHTYLDLDDMVYIELGEEDEDNLSAPRKSQKSPPPAARQDRPQMPPMMPMPGGQQMPMPGGVPMPPQMPTQIPPQVPPHMQQQHGQNGGPPPMMHPQQPMPPQNDGWGRMNNNNNNAYPGPPGSVDGSVDNDRRRGGAGRGGNKRRRSPSPVRRGRRPNSPPRVSRHTPPADFPEGIPWLMSQLASKTVFAAHGPILDWQHLLHLISTTPLPATHDQQARGRDRSVSPQRRGVQGGRRRSPDYAGRNRR